MTVRVNQPRDGVGDRPAAEPGMLPQLAPIVLDARRLLGRNFLLGNKQGFMLHLPAANGVNPRSIHRSKWYGGWRCGRKFFEALVPVDQEGLLCRSRQVAFRTDGVVAERRYTAPNGESPVEKFFTPDRLPAFLWTLHGGRDVTLEPYFLFRLHRGISREQAYHMKATHEGVAVWGTVEMLSGDIAEGVDSGGSPVPVSEPLWAVCLREGADLEFLNSPDRWRPMWYSLDAARRRYLRRLALRDTPIVEHAPLWDMVSDWAYSPCRIHARPGTRLALGFGATELEATTAARWTLEDGEALEAQKRERLAALLTRSWFSCGHGPTDQAYGHVLSRLMDCLVVSDGGKNFGRNAEYSPALGEAPPTGGEGPMILAGDAYFQEGWKRDENIALGGLLSAGRYDVARGIIDWTWRGQDELTGRLPLRLRVGERPGYTSSDATLWALLRMEQYVRLSGDVGLLTTKLPLIRHYFDRSLPQTRQGLLPSGGVAVPGHEWETWMDTEFSGRAGFPVEIQFLWLYALERFAPLVEDVDRSLSSAMGRTAEEARASLELFRHGPPESTGEESSSLDYFADQLTQGFEPVDLLTPNSYFWTVAGPELEWEWEERSLALGRHELGGISGVRTLARSQWASVLGPEVAALARAGRPLPSVGKANYHRGVEWNWLSQLFVTGELRHGRPDLALDHFISRQIHDSVNTAGLGGVSEVFDHRGPAGPDFQTWSMASLVESLHRFAGVEIDVPAAVIRLRPLKPRRWPYLAVRKWFGSVPFDLRYRIVGVGRQELEVTFPEGLPSVDLDITLPLPLRKRIGSLNRRGNASECLPIVDAQRVSHPEGIRFTLKADAWQQIVLASRP